MIQTYDLPLIFQRAAPFHPLFFHELEEALTRLAYHRTFVLDVAPDQLAKFTAYAGAAPLRPLRHAVVYHALVSPDGCTR